jgi:hypothetical protein
MQTSQTTAEYYVKAKREKEINDSALELGDIPEIKPKRHRRIGISDSSASSSSKASKVIKENFEGLIPFNVLIEYVPGVTVVRGGGSGICINMHQ